jgi:hypothetical protein
MGNEAVLGGFGGACEHSGKSSQKRPFAGRGMWPRRDADGHVPLWSFERSLSRRSASVAQRL